jgi:SPP1 family predicted phage head-tail adaptor
MRAGSLNDRVSLQQPATGQDVIGQPSIGSVEVGKLWANIRFLSGIQAVKADAPASVSKVSIQIRKRAGVLPNMQIVDAAGIVYRIDAVLPDKGHRDRINLACAVVNG